MTTHHAAATSQVVALLDVEDQRETKLRPREGGLAQGLAPGVERVAVTKLGGVGAVVHDGGGCGREGGPAVHTTECTGNDEVSDVVSDGDFLFLIELQVGQQECLAADEGLGLILSLQILL